MGFLLKLLGMLVGGYVGSSAAGGAGAVGGGLVGLVLGWLANELLFESKKMRRDVDRAKASHELQLAEFRRRHQREPRTDREFESFVDEVEGDEE